MPLEHVLKWQDLKRACSSYYVDLSFQTQNSGFEKLSITKDHESTQIMLNHGVIGSLIRFYTVIQSESF